MAILRCLFGPSREEIWRQLSAELGAKYVEEGFARSDKVQATHGEWTVTLDKHVVSTGKSVIIYTRIRAPYVNPDGFRFNIYRRGFFSDIAVWLGMQDVQVGFEPFDTDFIVKAKEETKVWMLLLNPKVRALIELQPEIHFSVKDDEGWFGPTFPEGVDELQFQVHGVIKDVARLKLLFDLFGETLDALCHMGSAYERNPNVSL